MRDKIGRYFICTGYEGKGGCFWCDGPLPARRKRYCSTACWKKYNENFNWSWASPAALKRADYKCEKCGLTEREIGEAARVAYITKKPNKLKGQRLEVHHKEPIAGGKRNWTILNEPNNLIVLCHRCHLKEHRKLRGKK